MDRYKGFTKQTWLLVERATEIPQAIKLTMSKIIGAPFDAEPIIAACWNVEIAKPASSFILITNRRLERAEEAT